MVSVVSLDEIEFRYGGGTRWGWPDGLGRSGSKCVLGPLSLKFSSGVTCLVGQNGAGKSTLMNLIVGLLSPSSGSVITAGDRAQTRSGSAGRAHLGLGPVSASLTAGLIPELAQDRLVLLATHLVEDVRALNARVIVLVEGEVVFDGAVAELEVLDNHAAPGDSGLERAVSSLMRSHH